MNYEISCQFCKTEFTVPKVWVIKNKRVFCSGCCKSFDVHVGEEENTSDVKEETLVELEKELDKAVDEFEPRDNDWSWF